MISGEFGSSFSFEVFLLEVHFKGKHAKKGVLFFFSGW